MWRITITHLDGMTRERDCDNWSPARAMQWTVMDWSAEDIESIAAITIEHRR